MGSQVRQDESSTRFFVRRPRQAVATLSIAHVKRWPPEDGPVGASQPTHSANNDLADLNHWRLVGVVRNVSHDLLSVQTEGGLEGLNGLTEDVAYANVRSRRARGSTSQSFVNYVALAAITQPSLDHGICLSR
jgi:hypothetical protein